MAFNPSDAAKRKAYDRQQANLAKRREQVTQAIIDKYRYEPDRKYADEFWAPMLIERGIDPTTLRGSDYPSK